MKITVENNILNIIDRIMITPIIYTNLQVLLVVEPKNLQILRRI